MDADKRAAYDRFGHAAFAQGGGFRGGFHDPFDIFPRSFRRRRRNLRNVFRRRRDARRRSTTRIRSALRHADHARGSGLRRGKRNRSPQARYLRQMQRQGRRARLAHDQLSDLRRPRPGHQLARIFPGFANLSALPRRGSDHRETVSAMRRRRPRRKSEPHQIENPRLESATARGCVRRATAKPAFAAARRATFTS